jgi:hypothetical protein
MHVPVACVLLHSRQCFSSRIDVPFAHAQTSGRPETIESRHARSDRTFTRHGLAVGHGHVLECLSPDLDRLVVDPAGRLRPLGVGRNLQFARSACTESLGCAAGPESAAPDRLCPLCALPPSWPRPDPAKCAHVRLARPPRRTGLARPLLVEPPETACLVTDQCSRAPVERLNPPLVSYRSPQGCGAFLDIAVQEST